MKKPSIFFIIISVILIITGIVLTSIGEKKAETDNIKLFKQTLTKNGDMIDTIEFDKNTNKISINLSDVDVNIIGNAKRTYAEIVNFNPLEYAAYTNNKVFTVENDLLSSIIGRAEGGNISFNGVRDYLRREQHNTDKQVNIYLESDSTVKLFDITIDNGNISVDRLNIVPDFSISVNKGNLAFKNTPELSLLKAELKKGNVSLDNMFINNAELKIENGDLTFTTPSTMLYYFEIESETGSIKHNEEAYQGIFILDEGDSQGDFTAHIGVGNAIIKDFPSPATPETSDSTNITADITDSDLITE